MDCDDFVQQRLAKVNSSNMAFKELIESLRIKNRQFQRHSLSEANPESEKSNRSQACFSEAHNHINTAKPIK